MDFKEIKNQLILMFSALLLLVAVFFATTASAFIQNTECRAEILCGDRVETVNVRFEGANLARADFEDVAGHIMDSSIVAGRLNWERLPRCNGITTLQVFCSLRDGQLVFTIKR